MSPFVRISAFALLFGVSGCELSDEIELGQRAQEIANGDLNSDNPSTGFLVMGAEINGQLTQIGTCSLTAVTNQAGVVSSQAVATARHCVRIADPGGPIPQGTELRAEDLLVFFSQQPGVQDVPIAVEEIEYHPTADLAMLKLATPAPAAATLVNNTPLEGLVGQSVRIAGYGIASLNGQDAGTKRGGTSTLLTVAPVNQALRNAPQALINGVERAGEVLFLGNQEGAPAGSNLCPGDSGGSTFMDVGGEQVLVGVNAQIISPAVNGEVDCTDRELIGVSVRLDRYSDFVNGFIARTDAIPNSRRGNGVIGACSSGGSSGGNALAMLLALSTLWFRRYHAGNSATTDQS